MIIGKISLRRLDGVLSTYSICDSEKDVNIKSLVIYKGAPIVLATTSAMQASQKKFTLNKHSYEIMDFKLRSAVPRSSDKIHEVPSNAVIHLVTKKAFDGIYFHCPSCDTQDKDNVEAVSVLLERLSNPNSRIKLNGVLHCKNCKYFYADRKNFAVFLRDNNHDVLIPRKDINIKDNRIVVVNDWIGASDSVLSRYGYSADGTIPAKTRRMVLRYILQTNKASLYELQNLLSGFIYGREARNVNAAIIWKSDLEWLSEYRGSNTTRKGIISRF